MKFDKSKVYTILNADTLEVGDIVFVADTVSLLKKFEPEFITTISQILSEENTYRFVDTKDDYWALAYLIAKHNDPYKELKKAQAEGKEVLHRDSSGNWESCKTKGRGWYFDEPIKDYSLVKPEEVSWKDFKLGDKVKYEDICQIVGAINPEDDTTLHVWLSLSGWCKDSNLWEIEKLA